MSFHLSCGFRSRSLHILCVPAALSFHTCRGSLSLSSPTHTPRDISEGRSLLLGQAKHHSFIQGRPIQTVERLLPGRARISQVQYPVRSPASFLECSISDKLNLMKYRPCCPPSPNLAKKAGLLRSNRLWLLRLNKDHAARRVKQILQAIKTC